MTLQALIQKFDNVAPFNNKTKDLAKTRISDFYLLRTVQPSSIEAFVYNPLFCLVLQGCKETVVGDQVGTCRAGQCLLVSHDMPVASRITQASRQEPYLALVLELDLALFRSLQEELDDEPIDPGNASAFSSGYPNAELIDALGRLLDASVDPGESKVLAPLIRREIHYRLLVAPQGGMLRHLLRRDSHASRIARAIATIRNDYQAPLRVPDLAKSVGMSASAFYQTFKSITATTPLQYQKDLRLTEARQLLLGDAGSVTQIAFKVGYESPTQFSREYARKFGHSPRTDMKARESVMGLASEGHERGILL